MGTEGTVPPFGDNTPPLGFVLFAEYRPDAIVYLEPPSAAGIPDGQARNLRILLLWNIDLRVGGNLAGRIKLRLSKREADALRIPAPFAGHREAVFSGDRIG